MVTGSYQIHCHTRGNLDRDKIPIFVEEGIEYRKEQPCRANEQV